LATPARRLAFRLLLETRRGAETLAERLARPDVEALPARERALLHELLLGTLRHRGALDHALAPLLSRPLARLDAPTLAALRLGAYQVLRLRVPAHAAVAESVDLVREARAPAAGFVNAVLRRLARDGPPPEADPLSAPLTWLTTAGSLPAWLAERWLARLGRETALARARALLAPAQAAYRLNPRAAEAAERAARELAPRPLDVPGAFLATRGSLAGLAAAGLLYPQDQGSQLVARLAARERLVLDACAAPGGKTTLVADLVAPRGRVVALEPSRGRRDVLVRLLARWGSPGVRVVGADALRPPFSACFDAVLLDAPCSGLGTLSRHPDIRWNARPADLPRHAARQAALLRALAPLVKPGGRLVYAACSLEPEENEGVVEPFLSESGEFQPDPPTDWALRFADGPWLRTLPEREGSDGFFAAVLRRAGRRRELW
jgi:16S rRNA (cytosine967-C5)-methyltransferase